MHSRGERQHDVWTHFTSDGDATREPPLRQYMERRCVRQANAWVAGEGYTAELDRAPGTARGGHAPDANRGLTWVSGDGRFRGGMGGARVLKGAG